MSVLGARCRTADEAGVSLVEVIMYSALTALVLSVLGGLFYVGFQTQAAVGGRDAATGAAEVVSNSVQTAVRNASSISVSGRLLKARVATGPAGWQCVAWALTADNKVVYKAAPVAITTSDFATWTVLAVGASGRLDDGAAFRYGKSAQQVSYSLAFTSGSITVPVAGAATANADGPGDPKSC